MAVCYNKLWKILIDRGMTRRNLLRLQKLVQMPWQNWERMKMYE